MQVAAWMRCSSREDVYVGVHLCCECGGRTVLALFLASQNRMSTCEKREKGGGGSEGDSTCEVETVFTKLFPGFWERSFKMRNLKCRMSNGERDLLSRS